MKILFRALLWSLAFLSVSPISISAAAEQQLPLDELREFTEVFGEIKKEYVEEIDDATLLRNAIDGMLYGLDPHSAFLDVREFEDMRLSSEGKFHGLGVEVTIEDGLIRIIAPIDNTPASRAGIQAGDLIVKLDGMPVLGVNLSEAVELLHGEPGSEVVLGISREGVGEVFDVTLKRAIIDIVGVTGEMLEDNFGYIRITDFHADSGTELKNEIAKLQSQNRGALHGLVLDLRNNPGGVLFAAVEVSDAFLQSGVIVYTRGRAGDANQSFNASRGDLIDDAPVVVLVNGGSASAAEIVAGALQDHKRAIIMGSRTFGKGSVQSIVPIRGGGALKITTARYYTPSNRSIQARGIIPDIFAAAGAPLEVPDFEPRESDLVGHLKHDGDDDGAEDDEDDAGSLAARDYQISEALNLLKGMSLVQLRARENKRGVESGGG